MSPPNFMLCCHLSTIRYVQLLQGVIGLQAHQLVVAGTRFVEHTPSQQQFPQLQ